MSRLLRALLLGWVLALSSPISAIEAPDILLANVYDETMDVSRYMLSEKLDGVRALWDGKMLRFRSGRPVKAPAWFVADFPKEALDGELWLGRGQFDRVSGIVRQDIPDDAAWREVRYMVFELPDAPGSFQERVARIQSIVREANVSWLIDIQQDFPVDRKRLQQRLQEVIRLGGEGLMLHRADAVYQTGRGDILLKYKPWLDAEATVVGHVPGQGRHAGQLGSLIVASSDGHRFRLGTGFSDAQRKEPPGIGSTVTYRYRGLTPGGSPRFASFLRLRQE